MPIALDYENSLTLKTPYGPPTRVPIEVFLGQFLPALPPGVNLSARVGSLRRRPRLWKRLVTKGDRLWGYSRRDPCQVGADGAFNPLETCFQRLSTAFPGRNSVSFVNNAGSSWDLWDRSEDALPDAWLEYVGPSASGSNPWSTIAVVGVYQLKANRDTLEDVCLSSFFRPCTWLLSNLQRTGQNATKLVWCMANCMLDDPARRFAYGFSVEDTRMSLWYCDRTQFVMSHSFDFVTVRPYSLRSSLRYQPLSRNMPTSFDSSSPARMRILTR